MNHLIYKVFAIVAAIYTAACSYIWANQESLLFDSKTVSLDHQYKFEMATKDSWYDMPDGARIHGVRFNPGGEKGLVLYFHGNGGNNGYSEGFAKVYTDLGYEVLGYDYRGYGKSRGQRSEEAFYSDALTILDAESKQFPSKEIILAAWSFGTTQAAYVAANRDVKRVLLFAPMASILDVGKRRYPFIPDFISDYPFRTDTIFNQIKAPVHIYHGIDDKIVPIASSQLLKPLMKSGDTYQAVKGANHFDIPWRQEVFQEIKVLLN